jgi:hypothetical protein
LTATDSCHGLYPRACFPRPRDPYSQFQEGKLAIETLDQFLAAS